jgi:hypothetical protein
MIPFASTFFQMLHSGRRLEPVVSNVSHRLAKYDENQVVDVLEYLLAIFRFQVVIRWSLVDQLGQQWLHKFRQPTTAVCKECHPEHSTREFKVMGILQISVHILDLGWNLHKVEQFCRSGINPPIHRNSVKVFREYLPYSMFRGIRPKANSCR